MRAPDFTREGIVTDKLGQLLEEVTDEASFLRFVLALKDDYEADRAEAARLPPAPYSPGPLGWENGTIGSFLEAGADWAEATSQQAPHKNPWHRCASILFAGKSYE
ncbi:hypothetical protein D7Y13_07425 [Corallococcus praedator]|uniref:DUF7660 domain-containing protein n=1 Tax=Corallococcus praedator TaxID=2316724 RepID=A0ABX9QNQ9_9BACT|nr:hypothetical protein D7X75_13715 [Corallococcus sp. CA031C]RKI13534.1 hypothetical protein D7Y13_07425 [Corallococcus praedator]